MPLTPEAFTIDPQNATIHIDIHTLGGDTVTAYTAQDGDTPFTLPVAIDTPTSFYFVGSDPAQIREPGDTVIRSDISATKYLVSAKFKGVEVAGPGGEQARLEARSASYVSLYVDINNGAAELASLLDSGSFASARVLTSFRVGQDDYNEFVLGTGEEQVMIFVGSYGANDAVFLCAASVEDDAGASDLAGIFGGTLSRSQQTFIAEQVGTIDVAAFNAALTALARFGILAQGSGQPD